MRAWRMARVTYIPSHADLLVARVVGWATMGDPVSRGPGLDQGDAVQFCTHLAYLRSAAACGIEPYQQAWYKLPETAGKATFLGVRTGLQHPPYGVAGRLGSVPIYGQEPISKPAYGSGQMGEQWPRDVALACDTVIRTVARAEQGPEVVPGWGGEFPGGAEPIPGGIGVGAISVIVAGAAVAVVGSFAAWRYFSPEVRMQAASVAVAARAYETRLRAMITNGVELPPSPIELASAEAVRSAAKESRDSNLMVGAGVVAGVGVTATLLSYIRGRQAA